MLINLADIKDQAALSQFERMVSKERLATLELTPIQGNFDLSHLQDIHRFLFQDIYPFAGQLRTEDISKDGFSFAPTQFMESSANDLFKQLHRENLLSTLPVDSFADRAAYYMSEINVIHPFREGNGRVQREFIRELANHAGHELDWSKVDPERTFKASVRSKVDTHDLADVIRETIVEIETSKLN